jgi:hypothetical protein
MDHWKAGKKGYFDVSFGSVGHPSSSDTCLGVLFWRNGG